MKANYTTEEQGAAQAIIAELSDDRISEGIGKLRDLKDGTYAAIPDKQRQSRGITWVVQRIAKLLVDVCGDDDAQVRAIAELLYDRLEGDDRLIGVPIFMMAAYGAEHPRAALDFFIITGASSDWVVREWW